MFREALDRLDKWLHKRNRKPLVLRGAQQVGKTWLVRDLAARTGMDLIELNFEFDAGFADHFNSSSPIKVLESLETHFGRKFDIKNTLLFLDEI